MADPKTARNSELLGSNHARPYLIFSLDNALFGADIRSIRRVSRVGRIAQQPGQPEYVKGLSIIDGRSLKIIDLRLRFGLPEITYHEHTCALELNGEPPCAVVVDSVKRVERFAERDIIGRDAGNRHHPRPVIGVIRRDDFLCMLLDLHCILTKDLVTSSIDTSGHQQESATESQARSALAERRPFERGNDNDIDMIGPPSSFSSPEYLAVSATASSSHELDGPVHEPEPLRIHESVQIEGPSPSESAVLVERALKSLAVPMKVGTRRIPRFRSGDPRLVAMASALLEMPSTFRTTELAPVVAGLLDRAVKEYGVRHVRYDLAKLRARGLAERIGSSRRYRLTKIGNIACRTLAADGLTKISQKCRVA